MEKEALKRIFEFIEKEEGHKVPFLWKLFNNIPLRKEELIVDGDLYLFDSKITSLPEGLKVGGYLNLSDCKKLTSLPKGLKVGSFLNITDSALTKYTDDELRDMVKPGFIKGEIYR